MFRRWLPRKVNIAVDAGIIAFAAGFGAIVSLWLWDRDYPITVHDYVMINFVVDPNGDDVCKFDEQGRKIAPCNQLIYESIFTRHALCETRVDRKIIDADGLTHPLPPLFSAMATSELDKVQRARVAIKMVDDKGNRFSLPDGPATLEFQSTWRCNDNPIHEWWPIRGPVGRITFLVYNSPSWFENFQKQSGFR